MTEANLDKIWLISLTSPSPLIDPQSGAAILSCNARPHAPVARARPLPAPSLLSLSQRTMRLGQEGGGRASL
jgi:hypothetical protein